MAAVLVNADAAGAVQPIQGELDESLANPPGQQPIGGAAAMLPPEQSMDESDGEDLDKDPNNNELRQQGSEIEEEEEENCSQTSYLFMLSGSSDVDLERGSASLPPSEYGESGDSRKMANSDGASEAGEEVPVEVAQVKVGKKQKHGEEPDP